MRIVYKTRFREMIRVYKEAITEYVGMADAIPHITTNNMHGPQGRRMCLRAIANRYCVVSYTSRVAPNIAGVTQAVSAATAEMTRYKPR